MSFERYGKSIGMRGDLKGFHEQTFVPMLHEETGGLVRAPGVQVYNDPSLLSCYLFDEIRGRRIFDHGPLANHLAQSGSPGTVPDGKSFDHTGTTFYTAESKIMLGLQDTYPDYTIVSWQYTDSHYNAVYGEGAASSNEVFVQPDTNACAWVMDDGVWRTATFASGVMAQDQWSCIVFSATGGDGNDWDAWYNGERPVARSVGSSNMRFDFNNIGYPYNVTGFSWHGIVRMVAIYSRRFTYTEALAIYQAGMYRGSERLQYAL